MLHSKSLLRLQYNTPMSDHFERYEFTGAHSSCNMSVPFVSGSEANVCISEKKRKEMVIEDIENKK